MKEYELTVLVHPDLEPDLESALVTVRNLVEQHGGKVIKEDAWGKKKLAYQVNRQDFAIYHYFELELPAAAPLAISNTLNITDSVLRYLLVKADEKVRAASAEAAKKADNESNE